MPFQQVFNAMRGLGNSDKQSLIRENLALRTELDEMRANINAICAKLDADAGVTDTNYAALYGFSTTGALVTTAAAAPTRKFTQS